MNRDQTESGVYYYGAPCPKCSAFQYFIRDDDQQDGRVPAFHIQGPSREHRCQTCGQTNRYYPSTFTRRKKD